MPTQISGSTGVSKVQDGVVVTADIADLAITPEKMSQKMTLMQSVDVTTLSDKTKCDFTGIPSWVKRITVMFSGVSTSGTSALLIRLGTSGGVEATGYNGNIAGGATAGCYVIGETSGFPASFTASRTAATIFSGAVQFVLLGTNTWTVSGALAPSTSVAASLAGDKTLSGTLDRVRITTVNGTDTFDAGSINIMYEG